MTTTSTAPINSSKGATGFHHKRISWASIFAGILVALGIQFLLSLLGIGIGMGAVNPLRDQNPVAGFGSGALIWWAITFLISLFVGGWIAGRLSRSGNRFESMVHGILTWVVFVMFNVYLLTSAAGSILNTAGSVVGNTMSLAGQGAIAAGSSINNQGDQNTVVPDSASIQNQLNRLKAQSPQAEAKARQIGNDVASALSKVAIYAFIGLLLGAFITALAATLGRGNLYNDYDDYDADTHNRIYLTNHPVAPNAIG